MRFIVEPETFFFQKIFAKGPSLTKGQEGDWDHVVEYTCICKHFTLLLSCFLEPLCSVNNLTELILEYKNEIKKSVGPFFTKNFKSW